MKNPKITVQYGTFKDVMELIQNAMPPAGVYLNPCTVEIDEVRRELAIGAPLKSGTMEIRIPEISLEHQSVKAPKPLRGEDEDPCPIPASEDEDGAPLRHHKISVDLGPEQWTYYIDPNPVGVHVRRNLLSTIKKIEKNKPLKEIDLQTLVLQSLTMASWYIKNRNGLGVASLNTLTDYDDE